MAKELYFKVLFDFENSKNVHTGKLEVEYWPEKGLIWSQSVNELVRFELLSKPPYCDSHD